MNNNKVIILISALFAVVFAVKHEAKYPSQPPYPYYHDSVLPNTETTAKSRIAQPYSIQEKTIDETVQNDLERGVNKNKEIPDMYILRRFLERKPIPTKCDALTLPRYSCFNCYSTLVCKPDGGKIKACKDPYAPYCNNGICTRTPSAQCSRT